MPKPLAAELRPALLDALRLAPERWSILRISNRAAKALERHGFLEVRVTRVEPVFGTAAAKILRGRLTPAGRALLPFARASAPPRSGV